MMDEVTRREPAPVAGLQPLEQVRRQRSPAGQRQNEAALRYWRRQLRTIPARTVPESDDRCEPRYREGLLHSPAMHLALRAIVAREGVDPAAVLLAVFAVAVSRLTAPGLDLLSAETDRLHRNAAAADRRLRLARRNDEAARPAVRSH
jgi:hypothetical protein